MNTHWNSVWSNRLSLGTFPLLQLVYFKAPSVFFAHGLQHTQSSHAVEENRESALLTPYCFTQCSNGCSLGSLLFPRQQIYGQRCALLCNKISCSSFIEHYRTLLEYSDTVMKNLCCKFTISVWTKYHRFECRPNAGQPSDRPLSVRWRRYK